MKHLTHHELYYIWVNRMQDFVLDSISNIAITLGKHRSSIYRAITYIKETNWQPFGSILIRKRNRQQFNKLTNKMKKYINDKLEIGWSPEIISGRMKKDIGCKISFKTIYSYVWQNKATGGKLYKLLPHHGKKYKYGRNKKSTILNRVDISQRPGIVDKKIRIGDLEGDTIVGSRGGDKACLLTLVDRASKFTIIRKIPDKTAISVEKAMNNCYDDTIIPILTITYDNGTEFTNHQNIATSLDCDIYFARPYKSSDRGLNEHTNGKIRWFYPKKTDFGKVTDEDVLYVQNLLNNRPRKSLGFLTPNEIVNKYLDKAYKKLSHLT